MEKFVHIADEGAMIVMGRYEQSTQDQSTYQSEKALEESFIAKLVSQGYERLRINNEAERDLRQKQYEYYRNKLLTFE